MVYACKLTFRTEWRVVYKIVRTNESFKRVKPAGLNSIHCRAGSYRFTKTDACYITIMQCSFYIWTLIINALISKSIVGGHVICMHNSDLAKKTIQMKSILLSLLCYKLGKVKPTSSSTHFQIDSHAPFLLIMQNYKVITLTYLHLY